MTNYPEIALPGAVVVITGGARGIGLETARQFAARGARVVIADLTIDAARDATRALGPTVSAYQVDAGSRTSMAKMIATVEAEVGHIEVMVNNAGVMPVGHILDESEAVAVAQFNVNFWGHYHAVRIVAPLMAHRGRGHIVNVTSGVGMIPAGGMSTYVASKHAATGFARSVREELAGSGVSVTAVLPAAVRTQLTDGIPMATWERPFVIRPSWVAHTIVRTVGHRRAVIGAPPGLVTALRVSALFPEPISHFVRKIALGRLMGPIDANLRSEYDSRIAMQADLK